MIDTDNSDAIQEMIFTVFKKQGHLVQCIPDIARYDENPGSPASFHFVESIPATVPIKIYFRSSILNELDLNKEIGWIPIGWCCIYVTHKQESSLSYACCGM